MSLESKLYIERQEMARRYLRGELPEPEIEAFEIYLMDNPDLVEHLELDEVLTACLPEAEQKKRRTFSLWKWITGTPMGASIATFAMTLALAMPFSLQFLKTQPAPSGIATGNVLFLETLRSSNINIPTLYLDPADTNAVLYLQTDELDRQDVTVRVITQSSRKTVVSTNGQLLNGELVLAIPRNHLKAGIYELNVSNTEGKEVSSHQFKVNLEEPNHGVQPRE